MSGDALQDRYAPRSTCFGCGPANPHGLRLKTREGPGGFVATWTPAPHHEAFPGMLSGGIIGTLLDCHSNWAAACHLMRQSGADHPPCTVTSEYSVRLLRPTPGGAQVTVHARVVETRPDRAVVEATLESGGTVCATCRGTFVAVRPGHPAYHRW
jgi:acyl-coenzyme A thioesterase PaaI-like protein